MWLGGVAGGVGVVARVDPVVSPRYLPPFHLSRHTHQSQ